MAFGTIIVKITLVMDVLDTTLIITAVDHFEIELLWLLFIIRQVWSIL